MQFTFLGFTGFKFPFAHFATTEATSYEIFTLFWRAIDILDDWGFKVMCNCAIYYF